MCNKVFKNCCFQLSLSCLFSMVLFGCGDSFYKIDCENVNYVHVHSRFSFKDVTYAEDLKITFLLF